MLKILHEKCDPKLADNKKLPYTSFLIEYVEEEKTYYDITMCQKGVELFDHYYDKYKKGLKGWKQTAGQVNPKQWNPEPEKKVSTKPVRGKRK